jgi:hypothetical protein
LLDEARAAASGPLSASDDGHDSSARSCRRSSMASHAFIFPMMLLINGVTAR